MWLISLFISQIQHVPKYPTARRQVLLSTLPVSWGFFCTNFDVTRCTDLVGKRGIRGLLLSLHQTFSRHKEFYFSLWLVRGSELVEYPEMPKEAARGTFSREAGSAGKKRPLGVKPCLLACVSHVFKFITTTKCICQLTCSTRRDTEK